MSFGQVQEQLILVEETMTSAINIGTTDDHLKESMRYSVDAGGKRIRPLLLLSTYALYSSKPTKGIFEAAAAVELIHTYSLIHDDLPAMDDDDLRRGQPTNHKVFGEALAILAGDGLLTLAFEVLASAELIPEKKIAIMNLLAKAAGTSGMVAGQAADMQAEQQQVSLDELKSIHERKTGELIRYSIVAGGILGNASSEELELLSQLAKNLGLAFQIRDDLLDVLSTTEELGKEVHRDEFLEKSTYPKLLGLEGAKQALQEEIASASKILDTFNQNGLSVEALSEIIDLFAL